MDIIAVGLTILGYNIMNNVGPRIENLGVGEGISFTCGLANEQVPLICNACVRYASLDYVSS